MQPYHIFPDEMMKELPGYVSEEAPAVALSEEVSYVAHQTLEKSFAYCRSVGVTLLTFKDVFTIVAGSFLHAGIPRDDMQQIMAFAADWFMKHPNHWATTVNPETGRVWLDSLIVPTIRH